METSPLTTTLYFLHVYYFSYQTTMMADVTPRWCFRLSASKVLILYCDVVGDYGWRKEVHVPKKPARCWVPQHWEAQRHTKRREKPCRGMDWKNKGQSMFPLLSPLFSVSPHPFTFPITFTYLEIQSDCGVIIQTFCSFFLFLYIFF